MRPDCVEAFIVRRGGGSKTPWGDEAVELGSFPGDAAPPGPPL